MKKLHFICKLVLIQKMNLGPHVMLKRNGVTKSLHTIVMKLTGANQLYRHLTTTISNTKKVSSTKIIFLSFLTPPSTKTTSVSTPCRKNWQVPMNPTILKNCFSWWVFVSSFHKTQWLLAIQEYSAKWESHQHEEKLNFFLLPKTISSCCLEFFLLRSSNFAFETFDMAKIVWVTSANMWTRLFDQHLQFYSFRIWNATCAFLCLCKVS